MSRNILDDHRIQEILEKDGIEGEVSSEIEDNLEIDDDDSNSSQSGDDDNSEAEDFSAGDTVTSDEKLEPFRGRCPFLQYMPKKPAKYGIKIFVMADSRTYYSPCLEVYTGRQNSGPHAVSNTPPDVVKRLVEQVRGSHRNVVIDNWFTSIPLMTELYEDYELTVVGTLRKNKPEIPPCFVATRGREE
ncbi:unnamed protein product [Parnassius apollo]|uniref:(apollo) hypothetical protein n=1 Tax=Parnassius apollo TaxID=110799 RepID=A0A8S3W2S9_PARAO|nr:unnamed protein product [Parnassius apollo]